ncbi:MAG: sigma-54-dependent Fis family transcriptional regulator [Thiotrichales bacterium]
MTSGAEEHGHWVSRFVSRPCDNPVGAPEDYIIESWTRCVRQFGLEPTCRPEGEVLSLGAMRESQEHAGELLILAEQECRDLFAQTDQSGYIIVLTNADGVVLKTIGDPKLASVFRQYHLLPGAVWSEQRQGTNGMGTCLQTRRPVIVHRADHFFSDYGDLTCTSAPIHDPHGDVIGVLDVSAFGVEGQKRNQIHTRALVQMSANFIEYKYFQRYFQNATLIRFHPRSEFLGIGIEALLALDDNGDVIAVNDRALSYLEIDHRVALINRPIDEIFSVNTNHLRMSAPGEDLAVHALRDVRQGRRFLATVQRRVSPSASGCLNGRIQKAKSAVTVPYVATKDCLDLRALGGGDQRMAYNTRCARRVADKKVYILLRGETGTGKEEFARAVHLASTRRDKNFIALNCAAIPESLIESELFGYKPGAFTGARREGMRGCVLESSGGTLFLDEIGDMPLHLQTRLLRVLETREILPLGSQTAVEVDLHVISASHRDLREMTRTGEFREDLFYRLNGITLTLPPLREREDVDAIIRCVLAIENDTGGPVSIEDKAFECLMNYAWPGNIRELRNTIRTALALSDDHIIRVADLPREIVAPGTGSSPSMPMPDVSDIAELSPLETAEREAILQEIERNRWNLTLTAQRLLMSRSTLYRKLKKYQVPVTPPE